MANKKLEYLIDAGMCDELYKVKNTLQKSSAGYLTNSHVAGLCLLGEKNGLVDTFVPMITDKGCWDSPEITHQQFYQAFIKLIKKDRRVIGMAIIKPNDLGEGLVGDVKRNIYSMRKTFEDISQTLWIVVSDDSIMPYRPYIDKNKKLKIRKSTAKIWKNEEKSLMMVVTEGKQMYKKIRDTTARAKMRNMMDQIKEGVKDETAKKAVKNTAKLLQKEIKVQAIRLKKNEEKNKSAAEKIRAKQALENKTMKIVAEKRKEYITPVGNNLVFVKTSDGKEILWQET